MLRLVDLWSDGNRRNNGNSLKGPRSWLDLSWAGCKSGKSPYRLCCSGCAILDVAREILDVAWSCLLSCASFAVKQCRFDSCCIRWLSISLMAVDGRAVCTRACVLMQTVFRGRTFPPECSDTSAICLKREKWIRVLILNSLAPSPCNSFVPLCYLNVNRFRTIMDGLQQEPAAKRIGQKTIVAQ